MDFKSNFDNISGISSKEDKISDDSFNDLKLILKECDFNDNTKKKIHYFCCNSTPKKENNNYSNKICNNYYEKKEKNADSDFSLDLDKQEKSTKDTNSNDKSDFKKNNDLRNESHKKSNIKNDDQFFNINNILIVKDKNNIKEELINYENLLNLFKINSHIDDNQSKLNIDIEFDLDKNYNYELIGKKRKNEKKSDKIKYQNEKIFNNIFKLYKKYNGNGPDYKILEQQNGFFNKNYTIIENDNPICSIYFNNKLTF